MIILKEKVETLNKKLVELNSDELEQVVGGYDWNLAGALSDFSSNRVILYLKKQ